jgi:hypothetical protein
LGHRLTMKAQGRNAAIAVARRAAVSFECGPVRWRERTSVSTKCTGEKGNRPERGAWREATTSHVSAP